MVVMMMTTKIIYDNDENVDGGDGGADAGADTGAGAGPSVADYDDGDDAEVANCHLSCAAESAKDNKLWWGTADCNTSYSSVKHMKFFFVPAGCPSGCQYLLDPSQSPHKPARRHQTHCPPSRHRNPNWWPAHDRLKMDKNKGQGQHQNSNKGFMAESANRGLYQWHTALLPNQIIERSSATIK